MLKLKQNHFGRNLKSERQDIKEPVIARIAIPTNYITLMAKYNATVQIQTMEFLWRRAFAIFVLKNYRKENIMSTYKVAMKRQFFMIHKKTNPFKG